ncbi:dihydroorotase [Orbus sturtevantii]|uniref:dihydroorotase n=1 Tax=Orbus sturtevantii TaxID=3074109 RepID=UPI00370D3AEF
MSELQKITIKRPDDWHLHLRDEQMLKGVVAYSSRDYARAMIMPNLMPPLKTLAEVSEYKKRVLAAIPHRDNFTPLMTIYLSDDTKINDVVSGYQRNILQAVKLYPAHATTNSADGIRSINHVLPVLEAMQKHGIPLLIHGEVTDPAIDVFDREAQFIDNMLLPLMKTLPELKIVLEHATTQEAAELVMQGPATLAATVTPQHILLNRNALFQGGLKPHNYCLPILKREVHRQKLMQAVTSGCDRFFLGTDSAPHQKNSKESACGCAGVFNAPVALSVYAHIFEQANALDKLEAFVAINGATFYQLPINQDTLTLVKKKHKVAETIFISGVGEIIPFLAGEELNWSVEN